MQMMPFIIKYDQWTSGQEKRFPQKLCGQEEVSDVPPPKKRKGRPCDSTSKATLEKALQCYSNSEEPVPLSIILRKMADILSETDSDSMANKWLCPIQMGKRHS